MISICITLRALNYGSYGLFLVMGDDINLQYLKALNYGSYGQFLVMGEDINLHYLKGPKLW